MVENAKTIMERFGFKDPSLTTPEHDKMLLWLNKNWASILDEMRVFNVPVTLRPSCGRCRRCSWSETTHKCMSPDRENSQYAENLEVAYPSRVGVIKDGSWLGRVKAGTKVIIEAPIMGTNNYNIGFVDFKVEIENYCDIDGFYISGFVKSGRFLFEIKPEIDSIGETIRQIQFYRSHDKGHYIIVTKTTGLKELFAQQGIYVYEYKED